MTALLLASVVNVFIIAGQSNAQGYGNRGQLAPVPAWAQNEANGWTGAPTASSDSGVQYQYPTPANFPMLYSVNGWTDPMVVDSWGRYEGERPTRAGFTEENFYGPELSFLRQYQDDHPGERIAAVKCVMGGTSLAQWIPGSTDMWPLLAQMIDEAKARIEAAGDAVKWGGLIWMQGENGATTVYPYLHPTPGQEYSDQLRVFLAAVRARTSPDMPVLIGRIGNHLLADNIISGYSVAEDTPANRRGATNYRRAQQEIVAGDPGNALASTDDLPVLQQNDPQWWYHHTGAGYLAMGERFYAALAGVTPPPPPPPPLAVTVTINGVEQPGKTATVTLNGVPVGGPGDSLVVVVVDR